MFIMTIRAPAGRLRWLNYGAVLRRFKSDEATLAKEKYQYLHKSQIPTLHFQNILPRLPIPDLKDTTARYLSALKPILCPADYVHSECVVDEFLSTCGPLLQKELQEMDKECLFSNYYCQFWLEMYLSARDPLPVNINPAILLEKDSSPGLNCQDMRACNLLISSLRFMKTFRDQELRPELLNVDQNKTDGFLFRTISDLFSAEKSAKMFKAIPVDMTQYRSLFNFSRIPKLTMDGLYQDESRRHVVVLRKGQFYVFDALDKNGDIISPGEILCYIRYILSLDECPCNSGLAALTTLDRNMWAVHRKAIREVSQLNAESLQTIDSAILALCLDEGGACDIGGLLHSILCGNGVNRWFDKSFNLVVDALGEAGINYEHSWGDGLALIRYINDIYQDSTKNPQALPGIETVGDPVAQVKRLEFCLPDDIIQVVYESKCNYEHYIKGVEVNTITCNELNKKYCKSNELDPNGVIQLAFQLAYYKLTGHIVSSYEPCSTGLFKHGRTEAIRPTTMETKEFCECMTSSCPPDVATLRNMLNNCSSTHERLTKSAAIGQGFDRHLFALRAVAEMCSTSSTMPAIFLDPAYEKINHNILSTSRLSSPSTQAGAIGPYQKDGLGIGYKLLNNSVNVFITNHRESYCGSQFIECLNSAFQDIYCIIHATR